MVVKVEEMQKVVVVKISSSSSLVIGKQGIVRKHSLVCLSARTRRIRISFLRHQCLHGRTNKEKYEQGSEQADRTHVEIIGGIKMVMVMGTGRNYKIKKVRTFVVVLETKIIGVKVNKMTRVVLVIVGRKIICTVNLAKEKETRVDIRTGEIIDLREIQRGIVGKTLV